MEHGLGPDCQHYESPNRDQDPDNGDPRLNGTIQFLIVRMGFPLRVPRREGAVVDSSNYLFFGYDNTMFNNIH